MTLKDIGNYKGEVMSTILKSEDIGKLILGKAYNPNTAQDDLLYTNVFPYLYVNDTQTETKSYVCFEVDVPRTMDFTYKNMKVIVWCYCHKEIMKYSHKGYRGTRADILTDMVDRLLNSSNKFGLGRLELQSANYFQPSKGFYGRQLVYSCAEFNIDKKL